jgi:hypothetical protein
MKMKMVANMESQLYGPTAKEAKEQCESELALKKGIKQNDLLKATLTAEYEASHPRHRYDTKAILSEGCYEARRAEIFAYTGVEEGLSFQDQMKNLQKYHRKKTRITSSILRQGSIILKSSTIISSKAARLSLLRVS